MQRNKQLRKSKNKQSKICKFRLFIFSQRLSNLACSTYGFRYSLYNHTNFSISYAKKKFCQLHFFLYIFLFFRTFNTSIEKRVALDVVFLTFISIFIHYSLLTASISMSNNHFYYNRIYIRFYHH